MRNLRLLYRLIGRPLLRDPARTGVTTLAVALGIAVIVAIDLAGEASAGSFRSSLETLQGRASYEIRQVGGVPEALFGELSRIPEPLRFSARIEGFALLAATRERVPVFGVDLLGEASLGDWHGFPAASLADLEGAPAIWVSEAVGADTGDTLELTVNDRAQTFAVKGVLGGSGSQDASLGSMVLMDLALAQRVFDRAGRLDRIYVYVPEGDAQDWAAVIEERLPSSVELVPAGVRSRQNRRMLGAFRWNLRILSYIALIVGAFLIYNTVAVSVVRRRPQIGIARAVGASRQAVRWAFLAEGCFFGVAGAALGLPLGRLLAAGAVESIGSTVQSLYVSSAPAEVALGPWTAVTAACAGIVVAIGSAWWPAREAALVPPTEAMAKARPEYEAAEKRGKLTVRAFACAGLSAGLCALPAWDRIPLAGYLAALGFVASAAMLVPAVSVASLRLLGRALSPLMGVAAQLGSRTLSAALGRTSVMVAALATATAMMVSVGIMVGSFRKTVDLWMANQLRADLYVRAEGESTPDAAPTIGGEVADRIESLPSVEDVDRFRSYPISFGGLPATLALGEVRVHGSRSGLRFLDGLKAEDVLDRLASGNSLIVSEPFSEKHRLDAGDTIELPLGEGRARFDVAGVYYDYSGEQGYLIGDRSVLLGYLPDPRLSSVAVYLHPAADPEAARDEIVRAVAGSKVQVVRNRQLRERAIAVFDRTFAITYALEAIAVAVAILGMAGALFTLVIDRRSELSVMRALGASRSQVQRIVWVQAGMLGLVSNLVGLLLGGALSLVLIKVINKQSFGWTIQFHWPVAFLVGALGIIYAASLAAGLYPARAAAAWDPSEGLHEE